MNAGFLSNTRFWRQPRVATVAFVALFVGGCNHEGARPVVSIADAKQIAAEFEGASFVPPPRTISDITAILDEQKPADPTKAAKAQAAATKEPPRGDGGISLARFYWERGLAAEKIGDAVQQIADLKTAERLSRGHEIRWEILWDLGLAEAYAGNFSDALGHREESLAAIPDTKRGSSIPRGAILAASYAINGDPQAGDELLAKVKRTLSDARSWIGGAVWEQWGSRWMLRVLRAEAIIL